MSYDVAVVGNGLFGSAACKYLAHLGASTICIGAPTRPQRTAATTVYSSHDDAARLVRFQARDEYWRELTGDALAAFPTIEAETGIRFHEPVGSLIAALPDGDGVNADPLAFLEASGSTFEHFAPDDRAWRSRWPMLDFPPEYYVLHEPAPTGYILPGALIGAQNQIATTHGAELRKRTVTGVARTSGGFRLSLDDGTDVEAERVLAAAGAFVNDNDLLPHRIALRRKSEVIVLAEVPAAQAEELQYAPTVKYLVADPHIEGIYMTPPVRYDDGRWCVKLGANTNLDVDLGGLDEVQRWFAAPTRDDYVPLFRDHVDALWPTVKFTSYTTRNCIITYSTDGRPIIEQVDDGLYVVTAGNGVGAMSSDAVGRRAAQLVAS